MKYIRTLKYIRTGVHLQNFDLYDDCLDNLYTRLMRANKQYEHLWTVTRKLLVLFHGQAAVEAGFSVNKDILVENFHEDSVVAQRVVFSAIQYYSITMVC